MHIPDGFLSAPVNIATFAVSAAVVGVAIKKADHTLSEKQAPMLGVVSAFIFAAQMINFPVAAGTSGHFLGAAMATALLGPFNAALAMALALTVQCLMFADGGLTALGSNIFNMGVVACFSAWFARLALQSVLPRTREVYLMSVFASAWFSVVLASGLCAAELAISGTSPIHIAAPAMMGVHAIIGIGEAIITVAVISVVMGARPDLVPGVKLAVEEA